MKFLLEDRHLTQSELSKITGYSRHVISHYVNNRSYMSPAVMKTISEVLKCNMEDLYEWEWNDR